MYYINYNICAGKNNLSIFDEAHFFDANSGHNTEDLVVIVLANKILFIIGITPVCIGWYSKYKVGNGA